MELVVESVSEQFVVAVATAVVAAFVEPAVHLVVAVAAEVGILVAVGFEPIVVPALELALVLEPELELASFSKSGTVVEHKVAVVGCRFVAAVCSSDYQKWFAEDVQQQL